MSKSKHFSTKSVFSQLIYLIDPKLIRDSAVESKSDRYTKKFTSKDHLISMLFCCFAKCLIPSDQTCNAVNKKNTFFTDKYHLNPHLSGYIESINFEPIGLNTSYEVNKIQLNISENKKTERYKKINGNNEPLVEKGKEGNLNVFKIRSKHDDQQYLASRILKTLNATYPNIEHINKYLKQLTENLKIEDSYVQWYEKEFNVRFLPSNFNDKAYSKFCRDIHDYYYSNNKKIRNAHIIELIDNS